jgi:hypothetical protein
MTFKDPSALIFRDNQCRKGDLFGLLDPKDEGTAIFLNICNYLPVQMA